MKETAPSGAAQQPQADDRREPGQRDELGDLEVADGGGAAATAGVPPSAVEAAWVLRTLLMAGERHRVEVAGSFGLGASESQALGYLLLHGSRGQTDLVRDLGLSSSGAVTALVDRLEQRGLAERTPHPTDRRRLVVRLTTRGEVVATQSQVRLLESLDVIPADELPLLTAQLARLAERLQQQGRP